jgi:hypothetical protein
MKTMNFNAKAQRREERKDFRSVRDTGGNHGHMPVAPPFWSAVAKRSDDTAPGRTRACRTKGTLRARESGVALRFPPQSKIVLSCAGAFVQFLAPFATLRLCVPSGYA